MRRNVSVVKAKSVRMMKRPPVEKTIHAEECMKIHSNAVEYSKQAVQYMFLANGGAITTLLVRFEIDKYQFPAFLFGVGVLYSILIPIVFYSKCTSAVISYITKRNHPFKAFHVNMVARFFSSLSMYFPAVIFLWGIIATADVSMGHTPRSLLELAREATEFLLLQVKMLI